MVSRELDFQKTFWNVLKNLSIARFEISVLKNLQKMISESEIGIVKAILVSEKPKGF